MKATQREIERKILNIKRKGSIRIPKIHDTTKSIDVVWTIKKPNLKFAGHFMRAKDD